VNPIKHATLASYYYGSAPLRRCRNRRLVRAGRAPIMAVAYHRIADDAANAWTTSRNVFRRGVLWLKKNFDLISLEEAQRRIRSETNGRPAVSISFDDGYAINCDWALPFLLEQNIPFTYFVTHGFVSGNDFFPHDWNAGKLFKPNTLAQIKELAAAGVEIGGHSRNHPDIGSIDDEATLVDEVVTSSRDLEDAIGRPVRYFAFPFGQHANLSRRAFELAADAGFEGLVSAYGGYNFPGDDPFHLQRMCVDGPLLRLKNWVTLDPYKQWTIPRYEYRPHGVSPAIAGVETR
jgi:peptidoglycan/xylan/chitin deacetylase (PgdA/CDA1 family)